MVAQCRFIPCEGDAYPKRWTCRVCGYTHPKPLLRPPRRNCPAGQPPDPTAPPPDFPPLATQAWNLATALVEFVADGCRTVDAETYRTRMELCEPCERRHDNRCGNCGCNLTLKARGRVWQCPLGKWPREEPTMPEPAAESSVDNEGAKAVG